MAARPAGDALAVPAQWARAQLLYELGQWDDAERTLGEPPDDDRVAWRYHAMAGLLAARRVAADLAAIDTPYLLGEPAFWRARIAAVLGEEKRAIVLLRQAFGRANTLSPGTSST